MKTKLFLLAVAAALVLFLPGRASACTANGTTGVEFDMTNNNLGLTGVTVAVCIAQNGGNTFISLIGVTPSNTQGGFQFINQIGIDGTSSNTFVDAFTSGGTSLGWKTGPDHCSGFDGFGPVAYTACGQGAGNNFTSNGDFWEFSGLVSPDQIVVHVAFVDGCTGFFGGSNNTTSIETSTACGTAPEPGSGLLSLLGIGLLASAGLLRRLAFS